MAAMLDAMHSPTGGEPSAHRFNRYELKYLVAESGLPHLHEQLERHMDHDVHQREATRISNLYYDTRDLRCYWEKIDGLRLRRKLRLQGTRVSNAGLSQLARLPRLRRLRLKDSPQRTNETSIDQVGLAGLTLLTSLNDVSVDLDAACFTSRVSPRCRRACRAAPSWSRDTGSSGPVAPRGSGRRSTNDL